MKSSSASPEDEVTTRDTGLAFEGLARTHLERAGLRFIAANVNYRFGELDLVMRDNETIVFVEVRYRRDARYGGGSASVTPSKQRRIALAASAWLAANPHEARRPCRFDVVAISGSESASQIDWIGNAFNLDDLA